MPLQPFGRSAALSLGVELELQLVNPVDYNLTSAANDLLELLSRKPFPGTVTPEMTQSMIEIATGIQTEHAPLLAELRGMRDTLTAACDRLNIGIAGGGTHPFQRWSEQRVFDKPRYREISQLYGYLAKQFTVFGQHVHVGCASGDDALFLLHSLSRYVPHFIALSASSPYFQGVDTLFDSARLNSVFAFPLSGRAPFTLSWDDFANNYFMKMEATGVVKSMKDFYWDIRPKPEYGTIELRVCDTPLTVERAAALACYLQAICRRLLERVEPEPQEDDYLVYTFNRFQACRFGLDGTMVDPRTRESRSIREDILAALRLVEPHGAVLGSLRGLEEIEQCAARSGNHATHLRHVFAESRNVQSMVRESARMLRHGPTA
jgi:carboxylate-amine ligase